MEEEKMEEEEEEKRRREEERKNLQGLGLGVLGIGRFRSGGGTDVTDKLGGLEQILVYG